MASAKEAKTSSNCQNCTETLLDPQNLPCGHQICANCLQQLTSSSAMTNTSECQSCGLKYKVSKEGVSEIPADQNQHEDQQSTNDGQAAAVQVSETSALPVLCTDEEDGPATVFCTDCNEFYCDVCADSHRRIKVTRGHNTRPVDQMTPDDVTQATTNPAKETRMCAVHQLPLNIVCKNCDAVVCAMCALFEHENHFHKELSKCAEEARTDLDHAVSSLSEHIDRQSKVDRDLKITDDYICTSVELAKTKVDESTRKICDIVKSHRADMIRDLDRYKAEARSKLASISEDVTNNKVALAKIKEETEKLLLSAEALELVEQTPLRQRECNDLKPLEEEKLTWKLATQANHQSEETLKALLGTVKVNVPVDRKPEKITLGEPEHRIALQYEGNQVVSGMVVLADCVCVTHFDDPHLWVYSLTTDQHKKYQIPDLNNPRDMTMLPSGQTVAIVDKNTSGCKLHFVNIGPSSNSCVLYRNVNAVTVSVKSLPDKNAFGINLSKDGTQLLIGQWGQSELLVCDLSGSVQREITVTSPDGTRRWPVCVIETEDGYGVSMMDSSHNTIIQSIDRKGNCLNTYGTKDSERMKWADQMAKSSQKNLVVSDYNNNRLHHVESTCSWGQPILTRGAGLTAPRCVYIDESAARLYLAQGSQEIRIHRWPSTSGHLKTTSYELTLNIGQFS